jgi:hypothetical protein
MTLLTIFNQQNTSGSLGPSLPYGELADVSFTAGAPALGNIALPGVAAIQYEIDAAFAIASGNALPPPLFQPAPQASPWVILPIGGRESRVWVSQGVGCTVTKVEIAQTPAAIDFGDTGVTPNSFPYRALNWTILGSGRLRVSYVGNPPTIVMALMRNS